MRASSASSPLSRDERVEQRLVAGERRAALLELAEHDAGAGPARAGRERQPPEQRVEQRRLAAAVRPDDREPLAPAHLEVERAEPERAPLDDGVLEADDDVAAARRRREPEPQLPRLVRLLDGVEPPSFFANAFFTSFDFFFLRPCP